MTDLSEIQKLANYRPAHKVRFVTAASLFDGHDASVEFSSYMVALLRERGGATWPSSSSASLSAAGCSSRRSRTKGRPNRPSLPDLTAPGW